MSDNTKYTFDHSDLDAALEEELGISSNQKNNKEDNNKTDQQTKGKQSSQEVFDGREELDNFFRGADDNRSFLQDDDELEEEDMEADNEEEDQDEEGAEDKKVEKKKEAEESDDDATSSETFSSSDILDIIREEGLLYIPEDFDGELDADTIDYFKEQTRVMQRQEIIDEMRAEFAGDPQKLRYLDYFMTGRADADLPRYQQIMDGLTYYKNFDVSSEDNQRAILTQFLKEGLDPNNPAHKMRLSKVADDVNEMISNYEGEEKAKEAKQYFQQKYDNIAKEEEKRVVQLNAQREKEEAERRQREYEWHDNFRKTLQARGWAESKKRQIFEEQYGEVYIDEKNTVPVWYAKEMMIKGNPELYQVYLDWLSSNFDLEKGKFIEREDNPEKIAKRKILALAKKKSSSPKQHETSIRRTNASNREVVNPLDNI